MYPCIPNVAVYLCHFLVGPAGSFEGLLHVNKIDYNTHSQKPCDLLGVRFPYNPLHLLCMQQLHTFSHKYELELKQCMINVWDCTGILPHQIKYSKKHITSACTHAHLLYNRNCIGTVRSTKLNYTDCSPITTKISCTKTQRS